MPINKKNKTMNKGPFKMKGSPMQRNFGIGSPVKYEKDLTEFAIRKGAEEIKAIGPRDKKGRYGSDYGIIPEYIMDEHLEKTKNKTTPKPKKKLVKKTKKQQQPKTNPKTNKSTKPRDLDGDNNKMR